MFKTKDPLHEATASFNNNSNSKINLTSSKRKNDMSNIFES